MSIVRPLLIAMLVLTEVGLWQWRMVIAARGSRSKRNVASGTLGALLQITAISQVVTNRRRPAQRRCVCGGRRSRSAARAHRRATGFTPGTIGVTVVTPRLRGSPPGLWVARLAGHRSTKL